MPIDKPMHISSRQAVIAGAMTIVMSGLVSVQAHSAERAHHHLWLAHLPPIIIMAGILWLLTLVLRKYPGQDLYSILAGRRWVGKPLIAAYVLFFFIILIRDLRIIAEFTGIVLLQNTPVPVISSIIMATVVCLTRGGLAPVGRMIELYGSVIVITFAALPLLLGNDFNWGNLRPVMHGDPVGVAVSAWLLQPYFGQIILLMFLCSNRSLHIGTAAASLGLGAGLLLILVFCCQLVLGDRIMARMAFPNYELVRHIRLTDFMDRLDLVLVGLVMPVMIICIAFMFIAVCLGLKQLLPKASGKRLTTSVGFLAYVMSFYFFENHVEVFRFNEVQPWLFLPFTIVLPALFFLLFRPKKRRSA